jgi:flagellar assembly protein FliH
MSTVIKAADRHASIQQAAFNFDDMTLRADEYLKQIRAQAAKILTEAAQQAEGIRKQAEADGRKAAEKLHDKLLDQKVTQQMQTVLPALKTAIQEIQQSKQTWQAHWEKQAIRLSVAIAEKVTRRQVEKHPEITLKLLQEALQLAAGSSSVQVYVSPIDHQHMGARMEIMIKEMSRLAETQLLPDAQISPGGCRIETRFGMIDQQFATQLARIEEELG